MSRLLKSNLSHTPLFTVLVEVFSIVLGVLLALGVAEWREEAALRERAVFVRQSLAGEIDGNIRMLEDRLPYYEHIGGVIDSLATVHGEQADGKGLEIPGWVGLAPALLTASSWQAALNTRAMETMDFGQVAGLSAHYSFQDLYRRTQERIVEHAITGQGVTLGQLRMFMREFHQLGSELLRSCRETRGGLGDSPSSR